MMLSLLPTWAMADAEFDASIAANGEVSITSSNKTEAYITATDPSGETWQGITWANATLLSDVQSAVETDKGVVLKEDGKEQLRPLTMSDYESGGYLLVVEYAKQANGTLKVLGHKVLPFASNFANLMPAEVFGDGELTLAPAADPNQANAATTPLFANSMVVYYKALTETVAGIVWAPTLTKDTLEANPGGPLYNAEVVSGTNAYNDVATDTAALKTLVAVEYVNNKVVAYDTDKYETDTLSADAAWAKAKLAVAADGSLSDTPTASRADKDAVSVIKGSTEEYFTVTNTALAKSQLPAALGGDDETWALYDGFAVTAPTKETKPTHFKFVELADATAAAAVATPAQAEAQLASATALALYGGKMVVKVDAGSDADKIHYVVAAFCKEDGTLTSEPVLYQFKLSGAANAIATDQSIGFDNNGDFIPVVGDDQTSASATAYYRYYALQPADETALLTAFSKLSKQSDEAAVAAALAAADEHYLGSDHDVFYDDVNGTWLGALTQESLTKYVVVVKYTLSGSELDKVEAVGYTSASVQQIDELDGTLAVANGVITFTPGEGEDGYTVVYYVTDAGEGAVLTNDMSAEDVEEALTTAAKRADGYIGKADADGAKVVTAVAFNDGLAVGYKQSAALTAATSFGTVTAPATGSTAGAVTLTTSDTAVLGAATVGLKYKVYAYGTTPATLNVGDALPDGWETLDTTAAALHSGVELTGIANGSKIAIAGVDHAGKITIYGVTGTATFDKSIAQINASTGYTLDQASGTLNQDATLAYNAVGTPSSGNANSTLTLFYAADKAKVDELIATADSTTAKADAEELLGAAGAYLAAANFSEDSGKYLIAVEYVNNNGLKVKAVSSAGTLINVSGTADSDFTVTVNADGTITAVAPAAGDARTYYISNDKITLSTITGVLTTLTGSGQVLENKAYTYVGTDSSKLIYADQNDKYLLVVDTTTESGEVNKKAEVQISGVKRAKLTNADDGTLTYVNTGITTTPTTEYYLLGSAPEIDWSGAVTKSAATALGGTSITDAADNVLRYVDNGKYVLAISYTDGLADDPEIVAYGQVQLSALDELIELNPTVTDGVVAAPDANADVDEVAYYLTKSGNSPNVGTIFAAATAGAAQTAVAADETIAAGAETAESLDALNTALTAADSGKSVVAVGYKTYDGTKKVVALGSVSLANLTMLAPANFSEDITVDVNGAVTGYTAVAKTASPTQVHYVVAAADLAAVDAALENGEKTKQQMEDIQNSTDDGNALAPTNSTVKVTNAQYTAAGVGSYLYIIEYLGDQDTSTVGAFAKVALPVIGDTKPRTLTISYADVGADGNGTTETTTQTIAVGGTPANLLSYYAVTEAQKNAILELTTNDDGTAVENTTLSMGSSTDLAANHAAADLTAAGVLNGAKDGDWLVAVEYAYAASDTLNAKIVGVGAKELTFAVNTATMTGKLEALDTPEATSLKLTIAGNVAYAGETSKYFYKYADGSELLTAITGLKQSDDAATVLTGANGWYEAAVEGGVATITNASVEKYVHVVHATQNGTSGELHVRQYRVAGSNGDLTAPAKTTTYLATSSTANLATIFGVNIADDAAHESGKRITVGGGDGTTTGHGTGGANAIQYAIKLTADEMTELAGQIDKDDIVAADNATYTMTANSDYTSETAATIAIDSTTDGPVTKTVYVKVTSENTTVSKYYEITVTADSTKVVTLTADTGSWTFAEATASDTFAVTLTANENFNANSVDFLANWTIAAGDTGVTIQSVAYASATTVTVTLTKPTAGGTITITAAKDATDEVYYAFATPANVGTVTAATITVADELYAITVGNVTDQDSTVVDGANYTLTADKETATAGDTVTVTASVTDSEAYTISAVTYTANGVTKTIPITNGSGTFAMPAYATEINMTLIKALTAEDVEEGGDVTATTTANTTEPDVNGKVTATMDDDTADAMASYIAISAGADAASVTLTVEAETGDAENVKTAEVAIPAALVSAITTNADDGDSNTKVEVTVKTDVAEITLPQAAFTGTDALTLTATNATEAGEGSYDTVTTSAAADIAKYFGTHAGSIQVISLNFGEGLDLSASNEDKAENEKDYVTVTLDVNGMTSPVLYYVDDANLKLVRGTVEGGKLTVNLEHFSDYVLGKAGAVLIDTENTDFTNKELVVTLDNLTAANGEWVLITYKYTEAGIEDDPEQVKFVRALHQITSSSAADHFYITEGTVNSIEVTIYETKPALPGEAQPDMIDSYSVPVN